MASSIRPWLRRLAAVCLSVLILFIAVVAALQIPGVATWAGRRLVTLAPLNPGYRIEIGRVSGNWLTGVGLKEVRLLQGERTLAAIEQLRIGYDPRELIGSETQVRLLVVDGARIVARQQGDSWDIAEAFAGSSDTAGGGGAFAVGRLELEQVEAAIELAPDSLLRVEDLTVHAEDVVLGDPLVLRLDTLQATVIPPGEPAIPLELATSGALTRDAIRLETLHIRSARSAVAGRMVLPRSFDTPRQAGLLELSLQAAPLALADISSFYPAIVPEGDLRLKAEASAEGSLATAHLVAELNGATVRLNGATHLGAATPTLYRVSGTVRGFDPAAVLSTAPAGSLTGELEVDLRGERLARADGVLVVRLTGSRLAGAEIQSLGVTANVKEGRAALRLRGDVAEAAFRASGWIRPFDSIPEFRLAGNARRIPGGEAVARALAGAAGQPDLDLQFRLGGQGVTLDEAALSGRVRLTAVRRTGDRVPLGDATLRLEDRRLRLHPELFVAGGRISGVLLATLQDTIRYEVRGGTIDQVDLGRLLEDTVAAPLSGKFALAGRGVSPEEAVAGGRLWFDELSYGHRHFSDVVARARLRNGRALLQLRGTVQGGTLAAHAAARPFDSPLPFVLDSLALDRVDLASFFGRPDLSGPVSLRATASGRWGDGTRAVRAQASIRRSRVGQVELAGGSANAELRGDLLSFDTSLRTASGSLALAGDARPTDTIPSIRVQRGRVDSLDLGALLRRSDLVTSIDARFTAGAAGTTLNSMRGRLDMELLPSRVNEAELGPGTVTLALLDGDLGGRARVDGPDAHLTADVSGNLAGDIRRLGAEGTLRLERLARWTGDSARDGRLETRFTLETASDTAGLLSAGGTLTAVGGMGRVRLQSLYLALEPRTGAIEVDTLIVRSNVAVLDGGGSVALRGVAVGDTLRLSGRAGEINALAALAGIDSTSLDSARIALTLAGAPGRRRLAGEGSAHRFLYASTLIERLEASAVTTQDRDGFRRVSGELRLTGLATGGVTVREAEFAGRYDSLISVEGTANFGRGVRLGLAVRGEAQGDTTDLRLERLQLIEGGRTWGLVRPTDVVLQPQAIEVRDFRLRAQDRQIALHGIVGRDTSNAVLRIDSLELGALERVGLAPLGGRLDASLHLAGPGRLPVLDGRVSLTLHDGAPEDLGRIESDLTWNRRSLRLNGVAAHHEGGRLAVNGILPWGLTLAPDDTTSRLEIIREPGDSLNLALRADSFEIALLRTFVPPETARNLAGTLALEALIRGTPEDPVADGRIRLADVRLDIPALDVRYRRGRMAGVLAGDVLRVDTLLLHTGENQELAARGEIRLQPLTNPRLDLTAELRDFILSNSATLQARGTGRIRLAGTLEAPVASGTIRMGRTEFYATGEAGISVEDVTLTPEDRLELARHFGPAVLARADERGAFLDRFLLDLDLRLPQQVWFRRQENPRLNVEVAGRIRLRQEPGGEMQFYGTVEPLPGSTLEVFGRRFDLTRGDIVLRGPVEEARIEVTAEHVPPTQGGPDDPGVIIRVAASGRPDSLALEFGSEPEMTQEDIISYIVTGRPSSDNPLVGGSPGAGQGEELALNQLAEAISGAVTGELGFDVFQIRQEGTRGLTLTAGRYLTPYLYVSLQQPLELGGASEQLPGSKLGPGFELQYRIHPWLRVTMQGGSLPPGMLVRGRYAY